MYNYGYSLVVLCTNWEYYQYSNVVPPHGTKFIHLKSYIHMKQLELKKKKKNEHKPLVSLEDLQNDLTSFITYSPFIFSSSV